MMDLFLLPRYEQYMFQLYDYCNQETRSFHDYTAKFQRLADRINLLEIEDQ